MVYGRNKIHKENHENHSKIILLEAGGMSDNVPSIREVFAKQKFGGMLQGTPLLCCVRRCGGGSYPTFVPHSPQNLAPA